MKALNLLRNLIFLLTFLCAASSANAAEGTEKTRKAASKTAAERPVKALRKEVAAFVDPTAPLAELVERMRTEQAPQR